jgi:translation initiation factor IF-2
VGDVTVSDLDLADASEGIVFGFNVPISEAVTAYAAKKRVELRTYNVIYDLIDEVTAAMEGLLDKVVVKESIGEATVRAVFGSGSTKIAGCYVDEGKLAKGATIEVRNPLCSHHAVPPPLSLL